MLHTEDVFEKIRMIVMDELGKKDHDVAIDSTFEDLGGDSLDHVEIILRLEDEFDMTISHDEADKLKDVSDALELVMRK